MDAPTLILVKHSLPQMQPRLPPREWRLSEEGRRRCALVAEKLRGYRPARIIASVEPKAAETGRLVAESLALPFVTAPGLHENDRTGVPWYDDPANLERQIARFFAEPTAAVMGRESADAAHARFRGAIDDLLRTDPDDTLVMVAHGTVISLLVSRAAGTEPMALWRRLGLPSFVALSRPALDVRELVECVI